MKFSTREDIEAPIEHVFQHVSDFDGFERQALRRGAEVLRQDTYGKPGIGSEWTLKFPFRGKERLVLAQITKFDGPNGYVADTEGGGLDGKVTVDLVALSPRRTRMNIVFDLTPKTLTARLLVQSLKFAKSNLNKRLANRVWVFAQDIEDKYQ
jgi:carbon monoxide dehydrogenase subunit G